MLHVASQHVVVNGRQRAVIIIRSYWRQMPFMAASIYDIRRYAIGQRLCCTQHAGVTSLVYTAGQLHATRHAYYYDMVSAMVVGIIRLVRAHAKEYREYMKVTLGDNTNIAALVTRCIVTLAEYQHCSHAPLAEMIWSKNKAILSAVYIR